MGFSQSELGLVICQYKFLRILILLLIYFPLKIIYFPLKIIYFPLKIIYFPLKIIYFPLKIIYFPLKIIYFPLKIIYFPLKIIYFPLKIIYFPLKIIYFHNSVNEGILKNWFERRRMIFWENIPFTPQYFPEKKCTLYSYIKVCCLTIFLSFNQNWYHGFHFCVFGRDRKGSLFTVKCSMFSVLAEKKTNDQQRIETLNWTWSWQQFIKTRIFDFNF